MITLNVQPYCQNCRKFEPSIDRCGTVDFFGETVNTDTFIRCEHADQCNQIFEYLKEKINEGKNTEVSEETV